MNELRPASEEAMAFDWANLFEYERICKSLRYPGYSPETLSDLALILRSHKAARLVLSCVRMGDYGNESYYWANRRAVTEVLLQWGVPRPMGKRPRPGFSEFVNRAAPMLIYFGLQPSASERSNLVRALRVIADGLGIPGDPREEVRRLKKQEAKQQVAANQILFSAFAEGLSGKYRAPEI